VFGLFQSRDRVYRPTVNGEMARRDDLVVRKYGMQTMPHQLHRFECRVIAIEWYSDTLEELRAINVYVMHVRRAIILYNQLERAILSDVCFDRQPLNCS